MDAEIVSLAAGPTGGLDVPFGALQILWALENRGLKLTAEWDRLRVSGPNGAKPELSEDEIARIRKWKAHLLALLAYTPP